MNHIVRKGQVTAASALVKAIIEIGDMLQVLQHSTALVIRCLKVERESTSREVCRYFGAELFSAANAGDIGT